MKPVETLVTHADAAWELAYHIDTDHLRLCSANGTCKLWNPYLKTPYLNEGMISFTIIIIYIIITIIIIIIILMVNVS